ncbi:Ribulose-5-phosphate 4-epimerase/Fuculose-1-phosphate aldolase [Rhizobiales bacterium GAS191]|jgi:ribulose-5-phosphate 4-epimerase/fuculose-1-phosphate aldolase|nr:Ribulose-5-phosphate 4-epimerase/Fuculose-1-phosphate aldolase [Rhizobiales bacterium GAS113]SED71496.1 Ribulose-5-phosphate 4-epimerase/Fuculose-1-phosphate aldolase [Rhizobiales bacterium GAS188]SEE81549.1 Ribulose-5-phosphate 4-epimerase/Fuculose-1-phosphate aldolase [Rhizobiales bacterium GAS191]
MSAAFEKITGTRSDAVRKARVDLAAALRLAVVNGFHEGIDNHFTLATPGSSGSFLLNPYGLHWSEVRASDLLEVDFDGNLVGGAGIPDRTAVCIHGPIHKRGFACVLHTHMPFATALTQLEDMTVEMIGQTALGFHGDIAYDYAYDGLALDMDEGERMAEIMGKKPVLMLANHGVIVCGKSVADAFHSLYFLERACQTQILAMSTGKPMRRLSPEVVEKTRRQFGNVTLPEGQNAHDYHFAALKRLLDRREPDYAD